ncbi:unnamed protein product [Diamesa hyperborea]
MLIFFCVALSMLARITSFEESYNGEVRAILEEKERFKEIKNKIYNFCIHPQALCSCTVNIDSFTFSCYNDDSENGVVIKISDFIQDTVIFTCVKVPSFTQVPDFTHYISSLQVNLRNCTVPDNETIEQLATKISKSLSFHIEQDNLTQVTNEIFDKMLNKFPVSKDFKDLQTYSDKADQNISSTIHGNITIIEMGCYSSICPLAQSIFANLFNLEDLTITGDIVLTENVFKKNLRLTRIELKDMKVFESPPKLFANMEQLIIVIISNADVESLPEDLFSSSKNIEQIQLTKIKLESLPKNIFVDQINLKILDLNHNELKKLVNGLFNTTINLQTLVLSHNKLTSISRYLTYKQV